MIERDRGQNRDERLIDHVRCIEPAAETCFEKHHVRRIFGKRHESRRGGDFEECDWLPAVGGFSAAQNVGTMPLADGAGSALSGEHDALVEPAQMG